MDIFLTVSGRESIIVIQVSFGLYPYILLDITEYHIYEYRNLSHIISDMNIYMNNEHYPY